MTLSVLAIAVGLLVAGPASAHSFDTVFVVPMSGPQAAAGKQAQDGFMFAARERDGHPDETADGHLGGLDVFLRVVDSMADGADVAAKVAELIRRAPEDTPWIAAPVEMLAAIRSRVSIAEFVPIDLSRATQSNVPTTDGRPFGAAFEEAFGYRPTLAVLAGYGVARRIEKTVRERN